MKLKKKKRMNILFVFDDVASLEFFLQSLFSFIGYSHEKTNKKCVYSEVQKYS